MKDFKREMQIVTMLKEFWSSVWLLSSINLKDKSN